MRIQHGATVNRVAERRNGGVVIPRRNWGGDIEAAKLGAAMKITILGGAGFLGRKIAAQLTQTGVLGNHAITELTLFDLAAPLPPAGAPFPVYSLAGDLVELPPDAIPPGTDIVFHLAAVVSAQAEADYELGRRVNLRGTDAVVDACRRLSLVPRTRPPRVVFTSSVASFSGGQGAVLADDARQVPANSYGAQKAAAELILADATRRGFLDAVSIRLPTITVRPGRPNKAASSFLSSILREPLLGMSAELPVPDDFAAWIASPRRATDWLLHAATIDTASLGLDRGINPPGISATVAQMLAALEAVKPGASALVRPVADADIAAIVGTWPAAFAPVRAGPLGFAAHEPLVDLVRAFVADDLEATRHERGLPD
jgi:nucleoside-diphosphate-sugar epimerase